MYNILELKQKLMLQIYHLNKGSLLLWPTVETQDEEKFTFSMRPLQKFTLDHDATRGHVSVSGPCCCPKP